jgi:replication-associated recombination protein RarA
MKNNLLKYKYEPKNLNDLVLLDRVKRLIENGVKQDYIFYGTPGCGKSTLCNIITKLYSSITIKETSVEVLRTKINDFCSHVDIGIDRYPLDERISESGFDIDTKQHNPDDIKVVFLDEFDDISKTFMENLKSFMESNPNVRFIATSNNVNNILSALKSRFKIIEFNARNIDEEKILKQKFALRIIEISKKEGKDVTKEDVVKIINKRFPDFRASVNILQDYIMTGELDYESTSNVDIKLQNQLYNMVVDGDNAELVFNYCNDNFGDDKIETVVKLLGKPFIHWMLVNKKEWLVKFPDITRLVTEYGHMLPTSLDPLILGVSLIYEMQKI